MAGGWAEVAGPGAGHVCGGDDWGDAAEFSLIELVGYESNGCHLLYTWLNGETKITPN